MKKLIISLIVVFSFFQISCSVGGSGSSGNNIIISSNDSRSSRTSDISRADITVESDGVQELCFLTSTIYACNYDFSTGHWNTETYTDSFGRTVPMGESDVFSDAYVSFKRGEDHSFPIQEELPNTIDIILFESRLTMVKINNQWYGDEDLEAVCAGNGDDISEYQGLLVRQHYIDLDGDGIGNTSNLYERLTTMNVAFVNKNIFSESIHLDWYILSNYYNNYEAYKQDAEATSRSYVSEADYTDYIGYLQGASFHLIPTVSENIFNEARKIYQEISNSGNLIVIPFDGIEDLGDRDIVISLTLDNMIKKITDTQVVWNDRTSYGAPIDYSISFR